MTASLHEQAIFQEAYAKDIAKQRFTCLDTATYKTFARCCYACTAKYADEDARMRSLWSKWYDEDKPSGAPVQEQMETKRKKPRRKNVQEEKDKKKEEAVEAEEEESS